MSLNEAGYDVDGRPFAEGEPYPLLDDRPLARLRVVKVDETGPDPLFPQVLKRRTHRGVFTDQPIAAAALNTLTGSMTPNPLIQVQATTDSARVATLRRLIYEGAKIEAHTPAAHQESVERTFIGARDVAAHPWGISLDQPVMTAMNALGLLTKPKMATPGTTAFNESLKFLKAGADTAQGFIWMTTARDTRLEQIVAGAAYLRANLAAAGAGLAMHPFSQGLQEYATQKPLYDALHRELAPDGGRVQMLARIGYPKAEVPPAPRRGLAAQLKGA